ncbi:hypothetical protein [Paraglaciecola sp.]|uniref:hypothetical protein n=1 Tax=Paraglaciecola sp. TaxID=1920173 RepID=UPI0030F3DE86
MTSPTFSAQEQLLERLQSQLSQHRKQVICYRLVQSLPLFMLVLILTYGFTHSLVYSCLSVVGVTSIIVWRLTRSKELADIHLHNYLLHLNRCYPELEESAQLISRNAQQLNLLQQLQQDKVSALLNALLEQQSQRPATDYGLKRPLALSIISAIVLITVYLLADKLKLQQWDTSQTAADLTPTEQQSTLADGISSIQVTVVPPQYSQLSTAHYDGLNLTLLAGSQVNWQLGFKHSFEQSATTATSGKYGITLSSGEKILLTAQDSGLFTANANISQSAIYTISSSKGKLDDVYTLTVTPDNVPQIRFLSPSATTTEIAKDGLAELKAEVVVTDDFALSQVKIQASIAKGSGEGVKFRDQNFEFDSMQIIAGKTHYFKHWQLTELGMEPGDEMYFSVLAWDNREPETQLTRSPSKIIRWLEEEQSELATEGILMDGLPEYFKSQRQIIIETEQLLIDKEQLELSDFKQLSTDLGFAQSDLKQKYGQYVGDEFEDATLHTMEAGPNHPTSLHADDDHDGEHHDDEDHDDEDQAAKQQPAVTHEHHEHQPEPQLSQDKSGASELIGQYGHNHGAAELGFTGFKGQPSPTALMKQAIANMWNAELHLMMSEPAQALPYEKQALKFLTQAKQAERIYVKRLGFEPPPVSESRRYQGELLDIKDAKQQQQSVLPFAQQDLLTDSINSLELWLNTKNNNIKPGLKTAQQTALNNLLMADLPNSPNNIQHIATLEKLKVDAKLLKQDCPACVVQLQQKLWRLLPPVVASPTQQQSGFLLSNPAINNYQQFLQQEQQP